MIYFFNPFAPLLIAARRRLARSASPVGPLWRL